jgi:hypothetical protein
MANRVTVPVTNFETLNPPWSLQSLDQDLVALQAALNDASLGYVTTGTDTGTVNNYVITTPAYGMPSAYNQGMTVFLVPANTNSGASTLTVGVLGSTPITDASGNPLASGALVANQGVWMTYSGTSFMMASIFTSQITAVRLRSFNAVGNPNFEVDQRMTGSTSTAGVLVVDRWGRGGPLGVSLVRVAGTIVIPGTNFAITQDFMRLTVTTQKASLAAGDLANMNQVIEGVTLRELISDVHSIGLLVRSSVAGLSFGVALRDAASAWSLTKLATIPLANTWTLITLPNLPVWTPSATWSLSQGVQGYFLFITVAAGSSFIPPANDTWQSGNFVGALGQSNFAANAVNSTFDVAFVQHEPGPVCTTLMDKPFSQNLFECQRYFQKSYSYGVKPGTVDQTGALNWYNQGVSSSNLLIPIAFKVTMAKPPPNMIGWSPATGTGVAIRDVSAAADRAINSYYVVGDSGFGGFICSTAAAANAQLTAHYTADTNW